MSPRHPAQPSAHQDEEEEQVNQAIQLSRREAQVARLSEEEQIQEAVRLSLLTQDAAGSSRLSCLPSAKRPRSPSPSLPQQSTLVPVSSEEKPRKLTRSEASEGGGTTSDTPTGAVTVALAPRWRNGCCESVSASASTSAEKGAGAGAPHSLSLLGGLSRPTPLTRGDGALDLLYFPGWLSTRTRLELKRYLLEEVDWFQVCYVRPSTGVRIVTPRFTTAFVLASAPGGKKEMGVFTPLPSPLARLLQLTESATGCSFNSVLLNFYQTGEHRIGFHSDDEAYLGRNPSIASLTLGASRDFIVRSKRPKHNASPDSKVSTKDLWPPLTLALDQGDLLLMRGRTQAEAEHAVPARKAVGGGRINLTFRLLKHPSGVSNYQTFARGSGPAYRFVRGRMQQVEAQST